MLKRGFVLAVVVAVLSVASLAVAADVEGKIQSVDPSGSMLTLADGTRLSIPATAQVDRDALKPGAHVKASYEMKGESKVVTSIRVQK